MDLLEAQQAAAGRHPWETARLKALKGLVAPLVFPGMTVLDIGCGDGFVAAGLFCGSESSVTAVDTNLSDDWISRLSSSHPGIAFQRELPVGRAFDLILLLDVLEHVADDGRFLGGIVEGCLSAQGTLVITVPAFPSLYGRHDLFLGHHRRYRLKELERLAGSRGLRVLASGHLFSSLVIPRLLCKLLDTDAGRGVGRWRGGPRLTGILERALELDNRVLAAAARVGVRLPGLTGWAICGKGR